MNTNNSNLQQGINNLLQKLKETETENELLKKEIKKLKTDQDKDKLIEHNVENGLKQLLVQLDYQVDSLKNTYEAQFNAGLISSLIDTIWKIFNYETCPQMIKDLNHKLREKLNKKIFTKNDYSCIDDSLTKPVDNLYDLNFLMEETAVLKQKVASQNILIKSIIDSFRNQQYWINRPLVNQSGSFSVSSLSQTTEQTTEFTTNSHEDIYEDLNQYKIETLKSSRQYFVCPKCEISIDKKQVTYNKFEQHVYKCEPSKLVCIFCLEIFDLKQEAEFDQHIQRHLKQADKKEEEYLPQYTNPNPGFIRSHSNSGSSCTNISSNLASSFSSRSNSNSNLAVSSSTDSSQPQAIPIQQQQQQQQPQQARSLKNCLLIQNFEPRIRKRL